MTAKKTSGKTAATPRAPHKKQEGKAAKAPTATAAPDAKVAARPVKAVQSKPTAKAAKAEKSTRKVTAPLQKSEATPAKRAGSERIAARSEAIPPQPAVPSRAEIAARAVAIWRETGGAPFDNWIRAERELGA